MKMKGGEEVRKKGFNVTEFVCAVWLVATALCSMFPILKDPNFMKIEMIIATATFAMGLVFWAGDAIINLFRKISDDII